MMEYEHATVDRMGRGCTTGSTGLSALIREICAIRGPAPKENHGFHGFFGRPAAVGQSRPGSVARSRTQSNQFKSEDATEANEANEVELPRSEPARSRIPFVTFATFCSNPFLPATRCAVFTRFSHNHRRPVKPVAPSRTKSHSVKGGVQSAFAKATADKGSKFKVEETSRTESDPVKPVRFGSRLLGALSAKPRAANFADCSCQANSATLAPKAHGGCKTLNFRQACGLLNYDDARNSRTATGRGDSIFGFYRQPHGAVA